MKIMYIVPVLIISSLPLSAMDQPPRAWDALVQESLGDLPPNLTTNPQDEQEQLINELGAELLSYDPHNNAILEGAATLANDALALRSLATLVLPICCQLGANACGFEGLTFGPFNFSALECSALTLNLVFSQTAWFERCCRIEGPVNGLERRRYSYLSGSLHSTMFATMLSLKNIEYYAKHVPALTSLKKYFIPNFSLNIVQLYLLLWGRKVDDKAWFDTVLQLLRIKYSLVGNADKLYLIDYLLNPHDHQS